jgi:hypothetical protein
VPPQAGFEKFAFGENFSKEAKAAPFRVRSPPAEEANTTDLK